MKPFDQSVIHVCSLVEARAGGNFGDVGVAELNEGVVAVGTWDLSHFALDHTWQEALALNDANIGVVGSGGDHLTNSELGRGTRVAHLRAMATLMRAIATLIRATIASVPLLFTSDGMDRSESLQKVVLLADHAWL